MITDDSTDAAVLTQVEFQLVEEDRSDVNRSTPEQN
jgi:hypothetical protein